MHVFFNLPRDVSALVRIVQGLALHEYMTGAYGVAIPDERRSESHIRPVERMLERLLSHDGRPLTEARPPERRLVGVCLTPCCFSSPCCAQRAFRPWPAAGSAYFNPGYFEDHWVCEYWAVRRLAAGE